MSKFVYVVDYWMPFPSSEYGGLEVYVAENNNQVIDMIVERLSDWDKIGFPDPRNRITSVVKKAKKIPASEDAELGYVDSFTT